MRIDHWETVAGIEQLCGERITFDKLTDCDLKLS
uniref:Transposase n=1 Tax=Heterorhabditis bacteriophora TaxID=37862 RepID=A0A1I7WYV9_HETBA